MSSTFTWLDYSEADRRKVLDVVATFSERETRDELGIGTIRDAFADLLFPGTSTIQTRARYFLFIPWLYLSFEKKLLRNPDISVDEIARKMRHLEGDLILALKATEEEGIIGRVAGRNIKRLPSNVYWQGLLAWGIRLFTGSQGQYHHSLSTFGPSKKIPLHLEDVSSIKTSPHWHPGLPPCPEDFPQNASFRLSLKESDYLRERILSRVPKSLLAFLVDRDEPVDQVEFPWELLPFGYDLPPHLVEQLQHAWNFSEAIHGAALLYNLMLARKLHSSGGTSTRNNLVEEYEGKFRIWAGKITARQSEYALWNRHRFWEITTSGGARVPAPSQSFVNEWLNLICSGKKLSSLADDCSVQTLIRERERFLKRGQARLENQRALETWSGAAGVAQLDFRWNVAETILQDIHAPARQEKKSA